jgi:sugar lactone lactonase YvrE
MKSITRIGLAFLFAAHFTSIGLAQSVIITTYAGPQMPVNEAPATTQTIDQPQSLASDGAGGFYVASSFQNRVYRVTANGRLRLVAGIGSPGFSGDGGPATLAQLYSPTGLAVDTAGNLFIADNHNYRIRRVTPGGVISTVAGNGNAGFSGDGGPATSAQLSAPHGLAVDATGNLFITTAGDHRVRKVAPGGVISTVAGIGFAGFSGDGGPATAAQLNMPLGVAVDAAGNLFIADYYNNRVRKVTPGGVISTVAGNGVTQGIIGDGGPATSARLDLPWSTAVDAAGNLFISEYSGARIRKVTPGGVISTVAGNGLQGFIGDGGPATSAKLWAPLGLCLDSSGNLLIADSYNSCVRKVNSSGVISTVAGNGPRGDADGGPAASAQLDYPYGLAVDASGNLFISDSGNYRVRKVTIDGVISTVAGNGTQGFSGDGGPATSAQLNYPSGLALDSSGNLFISDLWNHSIRKVTPGGLISTVVGKGTQGFSGDGGPATSAQLNWPWGLTVDRSGNLFIADYWNNRVRKVTLGGVISTVAGGGTDFSSGDGGPATSALLNSPSDVAVDTDGNLFIAEYGSARIRKVTPGGVISTVAGKGSWGFSGDGGPATLAQIYSPTGLAFDPSGNLFIADCGNSAIRKVTPGGIISTVAGTRTAGFSGDGGPATSAQISYPYYLASDRTGSLYIGDRNNNRVRKISIGTSVSIELNSKSGGSATAITAEAGETARSGYAAAAVPAGPIPYATAVFSFKQNGVTVSEAGVPASPPTNAARVFIDYRSSVAAIPGRISAGTIDINTGIAIVNHGSAPANITYTLRNIAGSTLSEGHGTLAAGAHFAKFINQIKEAAPDFFLPSNFQTVTQFATLEISSDQLISVLALRMTTNQRGEVLFTTTQIADLSKPTTNGDTFFPQFADGGGYTTSIVLLNTSNGLETGMLQILDDNGNPLVVNQAGGAAGSVFAYSIPKGGVFRLQTDGFPATARVGWARLTPDAGTSTPVGAGVFSYNPGNFLVTESGIPAAVSTTHARIYVDLSGSHNTGLAIANPTSTDAKFTIKAFQSDGFTEIGAAQGSLQIPANGHSAHFANEFVAGLPAGFSGVLDIASPAPFTALTMRSLSNQRGDFLLTTFPIADLTRGAPAPVVFPQIADGGGYATQFILIGAAGASSVTLNFYGEDGKPLPVGK